MEDLTASHWADFVSPSKAFSVTNHFHSLALDDPHKNSYSDSDKDNDEKDNDSEGNNLTNDFKSLFGSGGGGGGSAIGGFSALNLRPDSDPEKCRQKHAAIVSQLTQGADELLFESSPAPRNFDPTGALFLDKGSPIKADVSRSADVPSPVRVLKGAKPGTRRFRKHLPLTIILHMDSDTMSPNDPLFYAPTAATEASRVVTNSRQQIVETVDAPLYDVTPCDSADDFAGDPTDPAQPTQDPAESRALHIPESGPETADAATSSPASPQARGQSVTYTLGPNDNHLEVSVGDPVKVGDITTAHIEYVIKTNNRNPQSQLWFAEQASVSRRYRDFRWIYHQLQNNHPGKIIPPPPTKQKYIGRFNEHFVENRRVSLEKMLYKICRILCLANDPDLVMFLTSEDFSADARDRESASGSAALHASLADADNNSAPAVVGTASPGFISSLFSMAPKIEEPDAFFAQKRAYIEDLEFNLKTFFKSLEMIVTQRVETIAVVEEILRLFEELADVEVLSKTRALLSSFADVNDKLVDNLDRVNQQEQLSLGFTIEEYLRVIGLVKYTFDTRMRIYHQLHTFQHDLARKQESLDRLNNRYKASVDKINMAQFEFDKLQQKVLYFQSSFDAISDTIRDELDTFEAEKIQDFRNSVEEYIQSAMESQKVAIEAWETFYERHNLAAV